MQRRLVVTLAILVVIASGTVGCKKKSEEQAQPPQTTTAPAAPAPTEPAPSATGLTGEQLYKQHCAVCHPNGGNTITPAKTLSAKGMAERGTVKSADDVVKVMRNPGPGMNKFDQSMISDEDARKIGDYVMATFP